MLLTYFTIELDIILQFFTTFDSSIRAQTQEEDEDIQNIFKFLFPLKVFFLHIISTSVKVSIYFKLVRIVLGYHFI